MTDLMLYTVEWAVNPLASKVILTDAGRLRLKLGIAIDYVTSMVAVAQLAQRDNDMTWLDRHDIPLQKENDVEAAVERDAKRAEKYLLEPHAGDCTCVPMSCAKCHAESLLGFSVTEGLGKHEGYVIQSAFHGRTTIAQALDYIEGPITATWGKPEDWEPYMERWKQEHANAAKWLRQYRDDHLFGGA